VSCLVTWHVCGLQWIVWRLDVKGSGPNNFYKRELVQRFG
jgi:hypothetical protein